MSTTASDKKNKKKTTLNILNLYFILRFLFEDTDTTAKKRLKGKGLEKQNNEVITNEFGKKLIIVEVHRNLLHCFKLSMKCGCDHMGGIGALIYHVRNERGQRRPLYPEIITHLGTEELGEFISPLCLTKTHIYTIYTTRDAVTRSPS